MFVASEKQKVIDTFGCDISFGLCEEEGEEHEYFTVRCPLQQRSIVNDLNYLAQRLESVCVGHLKKAMDGEPPTQCSYLVCARATYASFYLSSTCPFPRAHSSHSCEYVYNISNLPGPDTVDVIQFYKVLRERKLIRRAGWACP